MGTLLRGRWVPWRLVAHHAPTNEDYEALADYTRQVMNLLHLKDRDLMVHQAPAKKGTEARTRHNLRGNLLELWVAQVFWDQGPEEQRITIVHEVLHAHTAPLMEVWDLMSKRHGPLAVAGFRDWHSEAEERMVDALSRCVAPGMPLPPWHTEGGVEDAGKQVSEEGPQGDAVGVRGEEGQGGLLRQGEQGREVREGDGQGRPEGSQERREEEQVD